MNEQLSLYDDAEPVKETRSEVYARAVRRLLALNIDTASADIDMVIADLYQLKGET